MDITQIDKVEEYAASVHRSGKPVRQDLLASESGLEGYSLVIARSDARYSPRHRQNFEQYRYRLAGATNYSTGPQEQEGSGVKLTRMLQNVI